MEYTCMSRYLHPCPYVTTPTYNFLNTPGVLLNTLESKLLNIVVAHQHQPLQLLQHFESCSNQMKLNVKDKETHIHTNKTTN